MRNKNYIFDTKLIVRKVKNDKTNPFRKNHLKIKTMTKQTHFEKNFIFAKQTHFAIPARSDQSWKEFLTYCIINRLLNEEAARL